MNKKTPKSFDAVKESRKWREETSRILDAMDLPARLAYLEQFRTDPGLSTHGHDSEHTEPTAVVRDEETP